MDCRMMTGMLVAVLVLSVCTASVTAQPAVSAWPMFGCDQRNTFRSTVNGPNAPVLEWSYTIWPEPEWASADKDGRIYVQPYGGELYCIRSNAEYLSSRGHPTCNRSQAHTISE